MKRSLAVLSAAVALAAAGCGGGGTGTTPAVPAPIASTPAHHQSAQATFSIIIPAKSTSTSRGRQYVSPDTQSVSFDVPGMTNATVVALTPGSSSCAAQSGGGYKCTATFIAPIGTAEPLTVKTYASTDGTGTPLSTNTVPIDVSSSSSNDVTVTLNGVAATLALALSPTGVNSGSSANITATWTALDAAGNTIVGPGSVVDEQNNTFTVALSSDASSGITIGAASGNTFAVTYDGSAISSPTFTAKATGATNVANGTATLTVNVPATATPSPTPIPTATPQNAIVNGNFASGALLPGWAACSYPHTPFSAPVNASPAPASGSAQTATPPPIASVDSLASVQTPPPNFNPNVTATLPPDLGSHVALTGDPQGETAGAAGICQTLTVPSDATSLSFWVYEGGSEYNFKYADQEADILDAAGTTLEATLFSEVNCFWNPGVLGDTGYTGSGCIPTQYGGTSSYVDWQGGYWTQKGPYDLSMFAGQQITLFFGVFDTSNHASPATYGNFMFVGNVQLEAGAGIAPVPVTIQLAGGHR